MAAASTASTSLGPILKRIYSAKDIANLVYPEHPLFAMVRKEGGFTGASKSVLWKFEDNNGRARLFSTAQANISNLKALQPIVTRVSDYALASLSTEVIMATKDDKGAFLRALQGEMDSAINKLGADLAFQLYQDGNGYRGRGTFTASGFVFTLANPQDVVNFSVGDTIVGSATTTGSLLNSGGGAVIATINRDTGVITLVANGDTFLDATAYYLWVKGDRVSGSIASTSTWTGIAGLEAWNPATAPSASESFFGVDRSADPTRNAGIRADISSYTPEEGLIVAMTKALVNGAKPDVLFLNPANNQQLQLALGSKVVTSYATVGDVGFDGIKVSIGGGTVRVFPDQDCPVNVGRMLKLDTWELAHLGDLINILDMDGNRISRVAAEDAFEMRLAFYGNMICHAPGQNLRLIMPTAA